MVTHKELACKTFENLAALFPKGKVLDVGCRDKSLAAWFEKLGFEWYGCDSFLAKDLQPPSEFKAGEIVDCFMEATPYPDDFFDVLFVCHSLEHSENPAAALREFKRVLKPGGLAFVILPMYSEHHILKADNDHISVLTPMQMKRLCKYAGLELLLSFVETNEEMSHDFDNQHFVLKK